MQAPCHRQVWATQSSSSPEALDCAWRHRPDTTQHFASRKLGEAPAHGSSRVLRVAMKLVNQLHTSSRVQAGAMKLLDQLHASSRVQGVAMKLLDQLHADLQAVHVGITEEGCAGEAPQDVDARECGAHKQEQQAESNAYAQAGVDGDEEAAQEGCQPHQEVHLAHLRGTRLCISPSYNHNSTMGVHFYCHHLADISFLPHLSESDAKLQVSIAAKWQSHIMQCLQEAVMLHKAWDVTTLSFLLELGLRRTTCMHLVELARLTPCSPHREARHTKMYCCTDSRVLRIGMHKLIRPGRGEG